MTDAGEAFDQAVDGLMEREFEESPRLASTLGRPGFDHRLDDLSEAGFARRAHDDAAWLDRFLAFDDGALTPEQSIDRALVVATLEYRRAVSEWEGWRRSPEGYLETGITELFLMGLHPEDELTDSAVARLEGVPALLEAGSANLDASLASRVVVERSLAECVADIGFARHDVAGLASARSNRERLARAGETAARAYERFAGFLGDLAATCTGSHVFGEERYNDKLRIGELLDTDVRGLRRRGWDEYDRVAGEMGALADRMTGGSEDWRSLVRRLQRVHARSPDDLRDEYEAVCASARAYMVRHDLLSNPADERCRVIPAPPAIRASLAVACYLSPPMFQPSRTGHFCVPFPVRADDAEEVAGLLESNASYSAATTAVHEAYPGHHWHLMTMKEARPVRRVFESDYFTEGWALYAEGMMGRAGFFSPEQELGQLEARLFRAARIVVDTSLHTGEMTVDDAVAFMHERTLMPLPTARSEVARYCAWPTQASAYLTGAMAIEAARDVWVGRGGGLKEFHDALAGSGALPVPLAVAAIGAR